jgi:hypothetical protein
MIKEKLLIVQDRQAENTKDKGNPDKPSEDRYIHAH